MKRETLDDATDLARGALYKPTPMLFLAIEADRPTGRGARYSLRGLDEVSIGRGPDRGAQRKADGEIQTLRIRVPAKSMSSEHANIGRVDEAWTVEDAGSRNGTFVNGERVDRARLADGDVIEMGHSFFVFREGVPVVEGTPADVDASELLSNPFGLRTLLPALMQQHGALLRIATSNVPVLLLGATGTGKELLARAVHTASGRTGRFVAVNCGALPSSQAEAVLFGTKEEPGFVRAADEGTLFLDEIGDLPLASQAALLRVLQEREVVPVGATEAMTVNLRVIAATHRHLGSLTATGSFRADLLGRLSGFTHTLPLLRDRREDLGVIVADILERVASDRAGALTLDRAVAAALFKHSFPMNVRELEQFLAAGAVLSDDGVIAPHHLPREIAEIAGRGGARQELMDSQPPQLSEDDLKIKASLVENLEQHKGNVAAVARSMGKAPMQIHRWMRRMGIDPNSYRR